MNADPLDNPVWHSLTGRHAAFATGSGTARRYQTDVNVWGAIANDGVDVDPASWADLAAASGPGGVAALFRRQMPDPPEGWTQRFGSHCFQMVYEQLAPPRLDVPDGVEIVELGDDDAADMLGLATLTAPGPFMTRTHQLGRFVGVRHDGALIAMAGERFRVDGATEISAVCTHPDHVGRGLGAALTVEIMAGVLDGGAMPFLHVIEGNDRARALYERLGFRVRTMGTVRAWSVPD